MRRSSKLLSVLLGFTLALAACGSAADQPTATSAQPTLTLGTSDGGATLMVFAAASLTDSFKEIGAVFQAAHAGTKVTFNFAGSQELRTQIEQGAKADVFASADTENLDPLKTANVLAGDPQVFAHNLLAVILPKANPANLKELKDLTKPGIKIVLADMSVPAGNYTLQILDKLSADPTYGADFKEKVLAQVVSKETNVKAVVSKVSLGEADAGVVYTTDAQAAADNLSIIGIPDKFNVIATYPIAVLATSANPTLARQFVGFVLGSQGQAILQKYGFTSR
jgi:molybdate transport system substrate-binding protein